MTESQSNIVPSNIKDITGFRFGRLVAVSYSGKCRHGHSMWTCKCDCGEYRNIDIGSLNKGVSKSCGCFRRESSKALGTASAKHRMTGRSEYRSWMAMKRRCNCAEDSHYPDYGGRGITICDRWLNSFENFFADMGPKPSPQHSIDRFPDNNGNYEPSNCRWATPKQQSRNQRSNRIIVWSGKSLCLSEWAEILGLPVGLLNQRLRAGWTTERMFTEPIGPTGPDRK